MRASSASTTRGALGVGGVRARCGGGGGAAAASAASARASRRVHGRIRAVRHLERGVGLRNHVALGLSARMVTREHGHERVGLVECVRRRATPRTVVSPALIISSALSSTNAAAASVRIDLRLVSARPSHVLVLSPQLFVPGCSDFVLISRRVMIPCTRGLGQPSAASRESKIADRGGGLRSPTAVTSPFGPKTWEIVQASIEPIPSDGKGCRGNRYLHHSCIIRSFISKVELLFRRKRNQA